MLIRILTSILILLSILFAPFWVSVVLALVAMTYFSLFVEAIFLFLISDLLFGTGESRYFNFVVLSSTISVLVLILVESLKKKLKFYA